MNSDALNNVSEFSSQMHNVIVCVVVQKFLLRHNWGPIRPKGSS